MPDPLPAAEPYLAEQVAEVLRMLLDLEGSLHLKLKLAHAVIDQYLQGAPANGAVQLVAESLLLDRVVGESD